ncbi:hypothetical protein B566_EDAN013724 [Ephemera danica]|nr:hypothetical protein B566_EDAN013724 [Ephemera danica]
MLLLLEIYRIVSQKQIRDPPEGDTIRPQNVEPIDVKPTVSTDSVQIYHIVSAKQVAAGVASGQGRYDDRMDSMRPITMDPTPEEDSSYISYLRPPCCQQN